MSFPAEYAKILDRINSIEPVRYGRSRNFIDGGVTRLSPYISRGVISTKQVLHHTLKRGFRPSQIEKFIQELAWRDYWQQIWVHKREAIDQDIKHIQSPVANHGIPVPLMNADTGIEAIDQAVEELYETGYMHNHVRMYTAAIACNMAHSHWRVPARWMYYHLFDGDWASNALSWQWVAGSNANKKYVANQDNVNKYCHTDQRNTFLDVPYEAFNDWTIPEVLEETTVPELEVELPESGELKIDPGKPTYLYNYYNLDPEWDVDVNANRIMLLEPSVFKRYPVSKNCIDFALALSSNIPGIQVYVGEFETLAEIAEDSELHFKEHPLNNYRGIEHPRDWMFSVIGDFRSFFAFWKKCKKELRS